MKEIYFLRCRECGKKYPNQPQSYCEECFAPLEVSYDYEALRQTTSREAVSRRAFNMWRYSEFLPLPQGFTPSQPIGGTPLVKSRKLGEHLGVKNLYFKNDAVCFPSLSFKDRVVATALAAARRFGFETIGCSSTGNLANAVGGTGRAARIRHLRVHSRRSGAGEDPEHRGIWRADCADQRQLRSCQPPLHADCGQVPLGTCERQPASVLRGRLEDARLRNRRAAWLGTPRQRGGADGGRFADRQDRQGIWRAGASWLGRAEAGEILRRPGYWMLAYRGCSETRIAALYAAKAKHDCPVAGHRESRRRAVCPAPDSRIRRLVEDVSDPEIIDSIKLLAETEGISRRPRAA